MNEHNRIRDQFIADESSFVSNVGIDIRSILDGLPDPAIFVDNSAKVILYNSTFFEFFSIRPRQMLTLLEQNESFVDALCALFDINPEVIKNVSESRTVKQVADVIYKSDDGNIFKGMRSYIPVLNCSKQCIGIIVHFRDFSPEAKMQERYEKVLIEEKKYADDLEKKVSEKTKKLTLALNEVTLLSRTDALTGLLTRQIFMELTQKSLEIAKRYDEGLAILMFDLDHFKQVNDTFGHQAGDKVLQAATKRLKQNIRETDHIGRYGGEEFIMCIKTNELESVRQLGLRCLDAVKSLPISTIVPGKEDAQTISIGCALYPEHGSTVPDLIKCADDALYLAKKNGRNQMVIFSKD